MTKLVHLITYLIIAFVARSVRCGELTFELPDSAKECFYEDMPFNVSVTLEYQVVTGGHYDVDVILTDPNQRELYRQVKSQFDSYQFNTNISGIYSICFSNEFSTFSHKLVYMDLQVGEEKPLPGIDEHTTALTKMESTSQAIHINLNQVLDAQTHHRLMEAQGRKRAEDINERVLWWSMAETAAILLVTIGQVIVLRNFFTDRKPQTLYSGKN